MRERFHRWVLNHDDSKVFVVAYIGLAVVLAIFLGLFWLAAVVCVHFAMEMVKQLHQDRRLLQAVARSFWELKLDIGLVLFGLVIDLYIHVVFGMVGLGQLGRAGAQVATRAGIWPRVLRGVLLTVDDVALVAKAATLRGRRKAGEEAVGDEAVAVAAVAGGATPAAPLGLEEPTTPRLEETAAGKPVEGAALWGGWVAPRWGLGDKIALFFTALNILLILATPLLTTHTLGSAWAEILSVLHPFPH
ncbi:MAG: hypothetical protein ACOCVR_02440 [Myxococcota bacterium]